MSPDKELWKQEPSFSKFRDLRLLIVSWNADSARPDTLSGDAANINFLHDVLHSVDSPDIISFGLQEVIDLESRKMAAKNVLLGNKKNGGEGGLSGLSDKVTGAYKRWYDALLLAVRMAMPPQCPYSVIHTESLVGLFTCIFVKNTERGSLKDLAITTIKRGMGGRYGNKVCVSTSSLESEPYHLVGWYCRSLCGGGHIHMLYQLSSCRWSKRCSCTERGCDWHVRSKCRISCDK